MLALQRFAEILLYLQQLQTDEFPFKILISPFQIDIPRAYFSIFLSQHYPRIVNFSPSRSFLIFSHFCSHYHKNEVKISFILFFKEAHRLDDLCYLQIV